MCMETYLTTLLVTQSKREIWLVREFSSIHLESHRMKSDNIFNNVGVPR
jgi:hypothetical protein